RASKDCALPTDFSKSSPNYARPLRLASRKIFWSWRCAANPNRLSTWSGGWTASRSCSAPRRANSNLVSAINKTTNKNSFMTSIKNQTEKTERKKRTPTPPHSAPDKVQAVLAVWTERCKPVEVCRQLNINWITFNHWQQRAMEGMLQ